jgi:hypothetical protein
MKLWCMGAIVRYNSHRSISLYVPYNPECTLECTRHGVEYGLDFDARPKVCRKNAVWRKHVLLQSDLRGRTATYIPPSDDDNKGSTGIVVVVVVGIVFVILVLCIAVYARPNAVWRLVTTLRRIVTALLCGCGERWDSVSGTRNSIEGDDSVHFGQSYSSSMVAEMSRASTRNLAANVATPAPEVLGYALQES